MAKRTKNRKARNQIKHAQQRAFERYGTDIFVRDINKIVKNIQSGNNANFLRAQSNRVSIFEVIYKGVYYVVVYDKFRKTLASFLPPEAKFVDAKGNKLEQPNEKI